MSKKKVIIFALLAVLASYGAVYAVPSGPFGYDLEKDIHRSENQKKQEAAASANKVTETKTNAPEIDLSIKTAKDLYSFVPLSELYVPSIDSNVYYSNPTLNSAIYKYKKGNYTGSLQELYSYIKKKPNDAYAFYYMGLNYSKIGENQVASKCFQKVINCNAQGKLLELAVKGRDCATGGIYCLTPLNPSVQELYNNNLLDPNDALDQFISAPYTGKGFSPEAEKDYQQRQLQIQLKKINSEESKPAAPKTNSQSAIPMYEKIAMAAEVTTAEPTNEEILDAIDVLKRAGLNINTGNSVVTDLTVSDVVTEKKNPSSLVNSEYEALNMMLGNNNNGTDPMSAMLPYMLNSNENGKNIDPQVIQAVMMNSMMSSINGLNSTENK